MEHSFGAIPIKKGDNGWEVFVIHQKNGDFWGFSKGHSDPSDEGSLETAARELKEETGLELVSLVFETPLYIHYAFERNGEKIDKNVTFYPAFVQGDVQLCEEEVFDGKWVPIDHLEEILTHQNTKSMAQELKNRLEDNHGQSTESRNS